MTGSSFLESKRKGTRKLSGEVRAGHSGEQGLAYRLSQEFGAPVGLLDPRTAAWQTRLGLEAEEFPTPDSVLTASLASGVLWHGQAFVWRPARDSGPSWLCLPIPREGGDIVAVVGFADPADTTTPYRRPSDRVVAEPAGWGPPCPERALKAWGQVVADDFRGEAFPRNQPHPARPEGAERLLVARLIRRMRISDAPTQFQELALRAVKTTLGLSAAAWIPSNIKEPTVLAGEVEGFSLTDYRRLVPEEMETAVFLNNERRKECWPNLRRFAIVAAESQSTSGWIVAMNTNDDRSFGASEVELLQPIASLIGNQRMNWRLYRELKEMLFGIIRALTAAIDAKDPYTKGHSERVARIAVKLAEAMNLPPHQRGDIYLMGLLHDVGKIGIHDEVLNKNGPLTPDEYRKIQDHVEIGVKILSDLKKLHYVIPAVRHHHEAYDGSGYPSRLVGEDIPFEARLLAVADAFDAMSSDRPYRKGLAPSKIDFILRDGAGRQWDPEVIEALFLCREDVGEITAKGLGNSLVEAVGDAIDRTS